MRDENILVADCGREYDLEELEEQSALVLDTFHIRKRNDDNKVLNKSDPEYYFARSHFNFILNNVQTPPKPIILGTKYTAHQWYDQIFCEDYPREDTRLTIEDNLRILISNICKNKTKWSKSQQNRNEFLRLIRILPEIDTSLKLLKRIVNENLLSIYLHSCSFCFCCPL